MKSIIPIEISETVEATKSIIPIEVAAAPTLKAGGGV
jgi:hypothetical protein